MKGCGSIKSDRAACQNSRKVMPDFCKDFIKIVSLEKTVERTLESTQRKNDSQAEFFLLQIVLLERPALGQVFLKVLRERPEVFLCGE